jgi:hypothetical protein
MKIQIQPNRWSCILTAFAIILDIDQKDLIKEIGHDGSEEWWPTAKYPYNKRGFHIQELIDCCLRRSYAVTQIEPQPCVFSPEENKIREIDLGEKRFQDILSNNIGVILGKTKTGSRHALSWFKDFAINPANGLKTDINGFNIQYFFLVFKSEFGLDAKSIQI